MNPYAVLPDVKVALPGKMTPNALRSIISDAVVLHADYIADEGPESVFDLTAVAVAEPEQNMTIGDLRSVLAEVGEPKKPLTEAEKVKALDDQIQISDELVQAQRRRIQEKFNIGSQSEKQAVDINQSKWAKKYRKIINQDRPEVKIAGHLCS
jgi:hypothetical protein